MNRIHIVGRKNHGKTTLVVDLVGEFCRRGVRVGTIKHSRHVHELDSPGKDSHRHRTAGSQPAAIITSDSVGIFLSRDGRDDYQRLQPLYADCQIVLVEGDIDVPSGIKVEVWRAAGGSTCLAAQRSDIAAVVSDDQPEVAVPVWLRSDIAWLADRIWELANGG
jgi:molybdopterin-guanine dinucleotide biosynthesis adapter protein